MSKPYVAKSLNGAQQEVRRLRNHVRELMEMFDAEYRKSGLLAKLTAKGPAFFNPLEAMHAEKIRDEILKERFRMNANGEPL